MSECVLGKCQSPEFCNDFGECDAKMIQNDFYDYFFKKGYIMERENLTKDLKSKIMKITFEKLDGSLREMRCTLQETYLPTRDPNAKERITYDDNVLPVWDLDKSAWRSFRIDSIKSISIG